MADHPGLPYHYADIGTGDEKFLNVVNNIPALSPFAFRHQGN